MKLGQLRMQKATLGASAGMPSRANDDATPTWPERTRLTVGSAARITRGLSTCISASTRRELLSRRVMTFTLRLRMRAASFWLKGRLMGPMPQPYISTRQPLTRAIHRVNR